MVLTMEDFRTFEPVRDTFALFGWPVEHTMSPRSEEHTSELQSLA